MVWQRYLLGRMAAAPLWWPSSASYSASQGALPGGKAAHWQFRRLAAAVPLAIAFLLLALGIGSAQSQQNPADAIAALRKAATAMQGIHEVFRQGVREGQLSPDLRNDGCQKLAEAVETLVTFGPRAIVENTLDSAQEAFFATPHDLPATLSAAAARCKTEQALRLSLRIIGTIVTALRAAADDIEAEVTFGPLVDNPSLYGANKAPESGVDMLRNLKFALDHDAVIRRDFFSSDNLRRFFGVSPKVFRSPATDIWAMWHLKPTEHELKKLAPTVAPHAAWHYSVGLRVSSTGKRSGWISISCNYPSPRAPTFEDVEQEFGNDWQDVRTLPLHGPPPPKAAPMGNAHIQYTFDGPTLRRRVVATFDPNADFTSISLTIEER